MGSYCGSTYSGLLFDKRIEEEMKKIVLVRAAKNFNEFSLTINALDVHREGLTSRQVSQLTKMEEKRERKNLKRLYEAGLVGKRGSRYFVTDENLGDIRRVFGPEAILLSVEFMTEEQKEIEYQIIND